MRARTSCDTTSRKRKKLIMTRTIIEQLADFSVDATYDQLPGAVIDECKRLILDSLGCGIAAINEPKGRAGIEYARCTGGGQPQASVLGTGERVSSTAAAFANGELINALDYDAVLPPGHVTPYTLPGALAAGEELGRSGKELIVTTALSHEMSYRLGKAMDYLRDLKDGKISPPSIFGYSSTIFGATAAIARMRGLGREVIAHALGISGAISPVNSHMTWVHHSPSTTIKYLNAGVLCQSAFSAAYLAEFGHRGDRLMLDDREYGFPRIIGTGRWEPAGITAGLGSEWRFPAEQSYKPYPHCRILHALLDALIEIVEKNDIRPEEITSIKAQVEAFTLRPIWLNRTIEHVQDAQFSVAHGIALGAQRVPPGREWQDPSLVFSPSVMALMEKVSFEAHPNYNQLLSGHAASRPARVEVSARGQTFAGERRYPKGSPSPEPETAMTTAELVAKFRGNAAGIMTPRNIDAAVDAMLNLEQVKDIATIMRLMVSDAPRQDVARAAE
jgi:2-methylcitrate dehydratase PrpD